MPKIGHLLAFCLLSVLALFSGCGGPPTTLLVFSGSENKTLEPLIHEFEQSKNVRVDMRYIGSLDIARVLEAGRGIEQQEAGGGTDIYTPVAEGRFAGTGPGSGAAGR